VHTPLKENPQDFLGHKKRGLTPPFREDIKTQNKTKTINEIVYNNLCIICHINKNFLE